MDRPEQSRREASATGVLENELVLEDLAALARACGFDAVNVIVASPLVRRESPAEALPAWMGGKGFARYWKTFCSALESHYYIVCYRSGVLTTRRPGRLVAAIEVVGSPATLTVRPGDPSAVRLRIANSSDTHWLHDPGGAGWTRLGAHLHDAADAARTIDDDLGPDRPAA